MSDEAAAAVVGILAFFVSALAFIALVASGVLM